MLEAGVGYDAAIFRVRDTGPGIAVDRVPHIFDQFWQGNASDRRGVGLGLAIAKAIVEAHGGVITIDSVLGKGSTFTVSVPMEQWRAARGEWREVAERSADQVAKA